MTSYYYLMAQLPGVLPNAPLPISYFDFFQTAIRFLTRKDRGVLERLSLVPPRQMEPTGSSVVDGFWRMERALRIELERQRAQRLGREVRERPAEDIFIQMSFDSGIVARAAIGIENPLEAERYLDKARYGFIERLRLNHFFDAEAVFAYGLSLLLREREEQFAAETGRASYNTICKQILGEKA